MKADAEEKNNLIADHPDVASKLRSELEEWSDTLIPPGLDAMKSEGMSRTAKDYYDWYLDGKRDIPAPTAQPNPTEKPQQRKGPAAAQLFQARDKDKDGKVTWEEYLAGRTGDTVPALKRHFTRRDTNQNGVWERSEIDE